jgi:hypothetical protein
LKAPPALWLKIAIIVRIVKAFRRSRRLFVAERFSVKLATIQALHSLACKYFQYGCLNQAQRILIPTASGILPIIRLIYVTILKSCDPG